MLSGVLAPWLARHGIHYGWVMVAVTFFTMLATAASMGMPGVLMVPLHKEFGWETTAISGAMALRLVLFGLMGPFAAALMARYGLKLTIALALLLIVVGLASATRMSELWHLWLFWGVCVGMGTGMTAMVLGATVASRWFTSRRGLVLGMLTASAATGQLVFLPIAAWLEQNQGWRLAVIPPICACCFAALLMVLLGADDPASVGQVPYGELPEPGAVRPVPRRNAGGAVRLAFTTLGDATGTRMFWILFFTFAVCGFTTNGLIQTHFIPLCEDFGLGEFEAAGVLAMMGVFDFVGTIIAGWLSDRYDNRWLLFGIFALRGASLLMLPHLNFTMVGLSAFAVFYGLEWIATVPPTVKLAGRVYGRERAPLVFGWIFTAHQLGAAMAAVGAGVSRDVLLSYIPAYLVGGVLCLLAAGAAIVAQPTAEAPAARLGVRT